MSDDKICIKFMYSDGRAVDVHTEIGQSILDAAKDNEIDLEGACEGSLSCSTCHVILEKDVFDFLEDASDDEEDMLDVAFGLQETSRLGCQVKVTKEMHNKIFKLPSATRNMMVDK